MWNNVGKPYFKLQIINEKEVRRGKCLAVSSKSRLMKTQLLTNVWLIKQLYSFKYVRYYKELIGERQLYLHFKKIRLAQKQSSSNLWNNVGKSYFKLQILMKKKLEVLNVWLFLAKVQWMYDTLASQCPVNEAITKV